MLDKIPALVSDWVPQGKAFLDVDPHKQLKVRNVYIIFTHIYTNLF